MLVTYANKNGFGLASLSGARSGYMLPRLKIKQKHLNHQEGKSYLLVKTHMLYPISLEIVALPKGALEEPDASGDIQFEQPGKLDLNFSNSTTAF